jgi:hypothetical protein
MVPYLERKNILKFFWKLYFGERGEINGPTKTKAIMDTFPKCRELSVLKQN